DPSALTIARGREGPGRRFSAGGRKGGPSPRSEGTDGAASDEPNGYGVMAMISDRLAETGRREAAGAAQVSVSGSVGDYIALLKPRVMSLVVFTALVGMVIAPGHVNPVLAFASLLAIAIGAGASGCLNMWWDADIDAVMTRTAKRPIPAGRIAPGEA